MTSHLSTGTPGSSMNDEAARTETMSLIAADKVEGTNVYDAAGNKLGAIDTVMLDKKTGHVAYAVMSFGGFLGLGKSHYPLPWNQMRYDTRQDGYVVSLTEAQLKDAPHGDNAATMDWADPVFTGRIDDHYRARNAPTRSL